MSVRASLAVKRTIVRDTARTLGARVVILEASTPSEIESVCAIIVRERLGALVISGENFFLSQRDRLVELAARHRVPTIYGYREFVTAGGLMSYGSDMAGAYRSVGFLCHVGIEPAVEGAFSRYPRLFP